MRKHYILIIALALLATACSGSTSGSTTSSSTTSLVVTTTSTTPPTTFVMAPPLAADSIEIWVPGVLVSQIRATAAAFEIDTGIGVDITSVEVDSLLDQLVADPASGPDAFIGPHSWLTVLTDTGIAEHLTAGSEVVAGALDAVTLRGTVFGAPLALDTIVQFRNTDSLASAPSTIESFAEGCPDGEESGSCLLLPADSVSGHYPFNTGTGGYIFGADEFEGWDAQDVGVDSAEALAGGLILQTIVDGAGILGNGNSTVAERFVAGDAPLLWGDSTTLAALTAAGAKFTVERLPTIAEVNAPTPIEVVVGWVNAFTLGKEATVIFMRDYLAAPSSADAIAVTLGLAPVNVGFDTDPNLVPFIESARTGDPVPTIFQAEYAWEQIAVAFSDIRDGDDASEALGGAATAIRNAPGPTIPADDEDA